MLENEQCRLQKRGSGVINIPEVVDTTVIMARGCKEFLILKKIWYFENEMGLG